MRLRGLGIAQETLFQQYGDEFKLLRPDVLNMVLGQAMPDGAFGGIYGYSVANGLDPSVPVVQFEGRTEADVKELLNNIAGGGRPLNFDGVTFEPMPQGEGGGWGTLVRVTQAYKDKFSPMYNGWIQVRRNPANLSWLSLGAEGGYRDPRLIEWTPLYGLITPSSNYLTINDDEIVHALVMAALLAGAGAVVATAAGAAAGEAVSTSSVTTASTASTAAASSTEAAVAGEEALREIGLAQSLGASITQGEAAGWVAALQNAGLSVPTDIAAIAIGSTNPRIPTDSGSATNSAQSTSPANPTTSSSPGSTAIKTATQALNNPLVKTAAGLVAASQVQSKPPVTNANYGMAMPQPVATQYDYASPAVIDNSKTASQTNRSLLIFVLLAGAGAYMLKKHKRKA